ncbi:hypothetical protein PG991_000485 [Apiospora marii]|uniref:U3 small nucleolar RNA-associated protein 25 n=1 Tax=Apiospora marii TaxID=335849 RepID=A0ABR1T281_9PEZI
MAPKGRQGAMRGGSRPRGRGGRPNGGQKRVHGPRFNSARLAEVQDPEDEDSGEESPSDEDLEEEDDSEDEGPQTAPNKSYMALMSSFAKQSAPNNKRRKLSHQNADERPSKRQEVEPESEEETGDKDVVDTAEEEPEEGPDAEMTLDDEDGDDEDDVPDTSDPFETHFSIPDEAQVSKRIKAAQANEYSVSQVELNGLRLTRSVPGKAPGDSERPLSLMPDTSALKLKQKLREAAAKKPTLDKLEQVLYPITFGYNDLLFCNRTPKNGGRLRRMACLHAVNHIFKTRDRVIKNNYKLHKEGTASDFEPKDQGFTRPKVLMILPTRQSAVKMVKEICAICEPDQQENRKRFDDTYVGDDAKFSSERPEDYKELFNGNDDDNFRLGVKFTRKTIKYFSQFYSSDILIASPLGLKMAIESGGKDKKMDYDYLSSIEMVILDQADALLNQNWQYIEFVLEHLNMQPREAHDCDFSRVREWYLEKQAHNYRQTLIFSAFNTPELQEVHRQCQNWAGRVRVQPEYPGSIQELGVKVKQTFSRFDAPSAAAEPDARFEYFISAIVPTLVKRAKDVEGTLIFVPSYFDYVRLRNYFANSPATANLTFGTIGDYASVPEASRAGSHFLSGRHKVLLYTERAHHFYRYVLNGVRRVIMYGLPDNPIFFKEIVGGYLAKSEQKAKLEPGHGTVRVMFSKYDVLKLERIVGSKRVGKMIRERGDTFDFI